MNQCYSWEFGDIKGRLDVFMRRDSSIFTLHPANRILPGGGYDNRLEENHEQRFSFCLYELRTSVLNKYLVHFLYRYPF